MMITHEIEQQITFGEIRSEYNASRATIQTAENFGMPKVRQIKFATEAISTEPIQPLWRMVASCHVAA
jgi:hypothetical protein